MTSRRPLATNIVRVLLFLRLGFMLLVVVFFTLTRNVNPEEQPVLAGIRSGIVNSFSLESNDFPYNFGRLIGYQLIPALFCILLLNIIEKRKFGPAVLVASLDLLIGFSLGIPVLQIAVLILILTNPTKNYLKKITVDTTPRDIL